MKILCLNLDLAILKQLSATAVHFNITLVSVLFSEQMTPILNGIAPDFILIDFEEIGFDKGKKIIDWLKKNNISQPCIGLSDFSNEMANFRQLKEVLNVTYVIEKPLQDDQVMTLFETITQSIIPHNSKLDGLFADFDKTIPKKIAVLYTSYKQIKTAQDSESITNFRKEIHKIAGSAGSYGYIKTGNLCKELQNTLDELLKEPTHKNINFGSCLKYICFYFQFHATQISKEPAQDQPLIYFVGSLPNAEAIQQKFKILVEVDPDLAMKKLHDLTFKPQALIVKATYPQCSITGQKLVDILRSQQPKLEFISILELEAESLLERIQVQTSFDYTISSDALEQELPRIIANILSPEKIYEDFRVMIVDDDPSITSFLSEILKSKNIDSFIVHSGHNLFEHLASYNPLLMFLDLSLPEYSGNSLLNLLRADIKYKDLPIIIITGERSEENLKKTCDYNINGIIIKPLNKKNILSAIEPFLKKTTFVLPTDLAKVIKGGESQVEIGAASVNGYDIPKIDILTKNDIVIIDDDKDIISYVKNVFGCFGYRIIGFETGASGLEFLLGCKDIENCCTIILDLEIPEIGGMAILKKLKTKFKSIPVIFLSAFCTTEVIAEGKKEGVFDFIQKPFTSNTMKQILKISRNRIVE